MDPLINQQLLRLLTLALPFIPRPSTHPSTHRLLRLLHKITEYRYRFRHLLGIIILSQQLWTEELQATQI